VVADGDEASVPRHNGDGEFELAFLSERGR
jgi:hypothetical protein